MAGKEERKASNQSCRGRSEMVRACMYGSRAGFQQVVGEVSAGTVLPDRQSERGGSKNTRNKRGMKFCPVMNGYI